MNFPTEARSNTPFPQLEEKYNEIRDERTKLSLELGDVLKPVTAAKAKMDEYISDHMVDLTPQQIDGLKRRATEWVPAIVQINVADANIVDRCESCHMNAREPLKITPASMTPKGEKKPDEYAEAFVSHTEPELLRIHDPEKFGCSPCHQGNGRATTSIEKAHGNYEHWLWPLFPKENAQAGCQNCHAADMVLASGDVQWQTINDGKDLFRQRGCMGCHRYEGYDKEPEDLNSIGQQIKQIETQKKDNLKQTAYLMKQADAAASNEEANQLNTQAVDLRVANSKLDGRLQQLDYQSHSLMQDQKKVGPNLKDVRLKLNKNWIPVWLKKPSDFRPTTKMPNFRLNDHQIQAISAYIWQVGIHRCRSQTQARQRRARKRIVRDPRMSGLPLDRRRRSGAGRNVRRESDSRRRKGELRLPGALDSQRPRAHASLLPVRKERHRPRGLRQEGTSLSVRSRPQPVPQRRPRTASAEHDGDAQPAPGSGRRGRHRNVPDDAEEAGAVVVRRCLVHGRSQAERRRQEVGAALRLLRLPRDCGLRRRRPHRHRTHLRRQQADRASRLRVVHRRLRSAAAKTPSRSKTKKISRACPMVLRTSPGTTTKDSSNTNWPSPTFTIKARSRARPKPCACPTCTLPRSRCSISRRS